MATNTISAIPALQCFCSSNFHKVQSPVRNIHFLTRSIASFKSFTLAANTKQYRGMRRLRAAEEGAPVPEQQGEPEPSSSSSVEQDQQPVSVPVSPSDKIVMIFQAEGIMTESAIPGVTKALEEMEGILESNVQVFEGLATVEVAKQTTAQATGVASSLVETIQGLGFKLQTLNLSFEEEEEPALA